MYEEEIAGDRHTDLLIRFAEACGTTRERVEDPNNMAPTTLGTSKLVLFCSCKRKFCCCNSSLSRWTRITGSRYLS